MRAMKVATKHVRLGFTLTELLIVVAVIALLAAMLLPAVGMVRNLAKSASCTNNLRQISLAVYGYAADNENIFPTGYAAQLASNIGYISWDDQISTYDGRDLVFGTSATSGVGMASNILANTVTDPKQIKAYAMYRCPAEPVGFAAVAVRYMRSYAVPRSWNGVSVKDTAAVSGIYAQAATNANGYPTAVATDWAAPFAQIRRTSGTIMLAEQRYLYGYLGSPLGAVVDNPYSGPRGTANGSGLIGQIFIDAVGNTLGWDPLHGKAWNYLFCDGHVEKLLPAQTVSATTALNASVDAASMWVR